MARAGGAQIGSGGQSRSMADARLLSWGDSLRELSPREEARLDALLARRLAGEPVQYVLESAWFMGLEFSVDRRVLIPRQDTETLCEAALAFLRDRESPARARPLCAGSGAIGLSLAKLCPRSKVVLSDVSADACAVIAENRRRLGVEAEIVTGDLFAPVEGRVFDLIACNPPYIRTGELDTLQAEVQREPRLALDGGADGACLLSPHRRRICKIPRPGRGAVFWRSAGTKRKTCARCLAAGACCAT